MPDNNETQQREKEKITITYAAIRIWPSTRTLLRKLGRKTETYDQIIQNLIESYIKKEITLHRAIRNQDSTPANYGKLDATRQETSSLPSSSINKTTMTSEDDFQERTTIPCEGEQSYHS